MIGHCMILLAAFLPSINCMFTDVFEVSCSVGNNSTLHVLRHVQLSSKVECAVETKNHCGDSFSFDGENCTMYKDRYVNEIKHDCEYDSKYFVRMSKNCPFGWQKIYSQCFFFSTENSTWQESQQSCYRMGGHLATIEDNNINGAIASVVTSMQFKRYWLGGSDIKEEGMWIWDACNTPIIHSYWLPSEPNNSGSSENCLEAVIQASRPGEDDGGDSAEKKRITTSKTTFTVWGRTDCPGNVSETVYSGYTGGSRHSHTGGAVEYVCLPSDPTWGPYKNVAVGSTGYMYGSEYQSLPDATLLNKKVPCAVCLATSFSTSIMIAARTTCYPGWTPAYDGQLSSGYHGHAASSQYICLSSNPQARDDKENYDGKLIYFVKTVCGSLPCPPYENNKLLSCVVCLI